MVTTETSPLHTEHHEHSHEHEHHHHEPLISQRWKWATVVGNATVGMAELATGNLSTLSVAGDGLHNVGDTATYYMQAENLLNPRLSEEKRNRMRKISYWILSTTSAALSMKAGVDIVGDTTVAHHGEAIYTASASLALNGLLLSRLRKRKKQRGTTNIHDEHEHDLEKHFWKVDIPSASLAVTGAVLQKYNVDVEQAAAIVSGGIGAWAFRPTKKNMSHSCLSHIVGDASAHENHRKQSMVSSLKQRASKRLAGMAMAGTLLFGATSRESPQHDIRAAYQAPHFPGTTILQAA